MHADNAQELQGTPQFPAAGDQLHSPRAPPLSDDRWQRGAGAPWDPGGNGPARHFMKELDRADRSARGTPIEAVGQVPTPPQAPHPQPARLQAQDAGRAAPQPAPQAQDNRRAGKGSGSAAPPDPNVAMAASQAAVVA